MTRRGWLRAACAALASLAGRPGQAAARERLSQQEAGYRNAPNGIQMCGTCTLFVQPNACEAVEGEVERTGWCRLYDMTD